MKYLYLFLLVIATTIFSAFFTPASPSQDPLKASMKRGGEIYDTYCIACHQGDGSGVPGLNPPLIKTKWVLGDKKVLINIILEGMQGKIEVDGEVYDNVMAPLDYLTNEEVADVLTYIRNSFGNKAAKITPAEVSDVRKKKEKK